MPFKKGNPGCPCCGCPSPGAPLKFRSPNYFGGTFAPWVAFDWDEGSQLWIGCLLFPPSTIGIAPSDCSGFGTSFDPSIRTPAVYQMDANLRVTRQTARCGFSPVPSAGRFREAACPPWPQSGANLFGPDPSLDIHVPCTETQVVDPAQVITCPPTNLRAIFGAMTASGVGDLIEIMDS